MSAVAIDPQANLVQDVVLYDSECNFCTASIETLRRLDGRQRLRFVSLHDPIVQLEYPDLTYDQLIAEMWVISYDGRRFGGADAMRYLSRRLPILFPLAPLLHIPFSMPLWRWMYRFIARNRYRIAGRKCSNGACRIHGR